MPKFDPCRSTECSRASVRPIIAQGDEDWLDMFYWHLLVKCLTEMVASGEK